MLTLVEVTFLATTCTCALSPTSTSPNVGGSRVSSSGGPSGADVVGRRRCGANKAPSTSAPASREWPERSIGLRRTRSRQTAIAECYEGRGAALPNKRLGTAQAVTTFAA